MFIFIYDFETTLFPVALTVENISIKLGKAFVTDKIDSTYFFTFYYICSYKQYYVCESVYSYREGSKIKTKLNKEKLIKIQQWLSSEIQTKTKSLSKIKQSKTHYQPFPVLQD